MTGVQTCALPIFQLYKLSNTDITTLKNEKDTIEKEIEFYKGILSDRKKLDRLLISELKAIASKYGRDRKTLIIEKSEPVSFDKRDLISKEEIMIAVSRDGYIKYSSLKSYRSSGTNALPGIKEGDTCVYEGKAMTTDYLICFTNVGNYLYIPVHKLSETKWKDEGKHINYMINLNPNEKIIKAFAIEEFRNDLFFVLVSKHGQIKRLTLSDFSVVRYSKPLMCMKLLQDDELSDVCSTNGDSNLVIFVDNGTSTCFNENELSISSMRSGGVKGVSSLKKSNIVALLAYDAANTKGKTILVTDKGCVRIYDVSNTLLTNRLGKLSVVFKTFKNEPHELVYVKKIDDLANPTLIRFLDKDKSLIDVNVDDYHVTPLDRYAKSTIQLTKKNSLVLPFVEGTDRIDNSVVSHYAKKEEASLEETSNENLIDNSEEEDTSEKGYTQISIFDED